jgi:hypothetical protein
VVPEDPNIELTKLARSLTLSTNVYSDAMSRIAKQTVVSDGIARSLAQQLKIERGLFASTDAILKRIDLVRAWFCSSGIPTR